MNQTTVTAPNGASHRVMAVGNFDGIFSDAWVLNGNLLCFVSLWGRPSRIMSLYGAITERLIDKLVMDGRECPIHYELNKRQMRMSPASRYGADMMHVMLYSDVVMQDKAGIRVLLDRHTVDENRLWSVLADMSELALLPHWRQALLNALREQSYISVPDSHNLTAERIDLSDHDRYQHLVQSMIQNGQLTREAV